MNHLSFSVALPQSAPFDRPDTIPGNWYDSFLGNVALPAYETGKLDRFWFSHYGALGDNPHVKFRFSTDDFKTVNSILQTVISKYSLTLLEEHGLTYPHEFDIVSDLVPVHEKAHYGDNQRHSDHRERGEHLYTFLSGAAVLSLHCLSHTDADGYWYRETNPDVGNNHFGDTTESLHHLYCNLSNVPTAVCVLPIAGHVGPPFQLVSPLYAKISGKYLHGAQVVRVMY